MIVVAQLDDKIIEDMSDKGELSNMQTFFRKMKESFFSYLEYW